jgi:hypothetical protein
LQVARRLTAEGPPEAGTEAGADRAGESWTGGAATAEDGRGRFDALERRLHDLEVELARARATRLALEEENEELRSQLEHIRSNLEGEARRSLRERVSPPPEHVDHLDMALLQQMLVDREQARRRRHDEADSA